MPAAAVLDTMCRSEHAQRSQASHKLETSIAMVPHLFHGQAGEAGPAAQVYLVFI